jgi:Rv2525c-like, glycoside hydrolase-like domain
MAFLRFVCARQVGRIVSALVIAGSTVLVPIGSSAAPDAPPAAVVSATSTSCSVVPSKPAKSAAVCGHAPAVAGLGVASVPKLPLGASPCPSVAGKSASSAAATCSHIASSSVVANPVVTLPAGQRQCPSTATKASSPGASCPTQALPAQFPTTLGVVSLPAGASHCPSSGSKPSSAEAACGVETTPAATAPGLTTVNLPVGETPCPSTASKPSSPNASCSTAPGGVQSTGLGASKGFSIPTNIAGYSISISESRNALAPGASTTLTATSNVDVGPTPYYIEIYDHTTHALLTYCGAGTTCSTAVTQSTATVRSYIAYTGTYLASEPPATIAATSGVVSCTWLSISLTVSAAYIGPGQSSTVTAHVNTDVGPTPYYIEVFDSTVGANVALCANGATCSVSITQNAATVRSYVAYVSGYGTSNPPPTVQVTSNRPSVVWFGISLKASAYALSPGGSTTLTASANADVLPSPYYIEIFDTSGSRVVACASGTACSGSVTQAGSAVRNYVAYVAGLGTTNPPPSIQATSSWVQVTWLSVSIVANPRFLAPGAATALTATASQDIGPTAYSIRITDVTANSVLVTCATGTTCATTTSQPSATNHNFVAYILCVGTGCPLPITRATSSAVTVSWLSVSIKTNTSGVPTGRVVTLTGTASADVTTSPYYIEIFDQALQQFVGECSGGTSCAAVTTETAAGTHKFIAYIATEASTWPPTNIQATSGLVSVTWVWWGVDSVDAITQAEVDSVTTSLGKPDFFGRYIGQLAGGYNMKVSDATVAHSNGIRILPIFSEFAQGTTSTHATGVYFAQYAATAARRLGIPAGRMIAVDIEPSSYVDAAFIQGWYDGMLPGGYVPAIYENPYTGTNRYFPGAYCTAVANEPAIASNLLLWSYEPSLAHQTRANAYKFAPDAPGCANQTVAWQYNLSAGSNPNVDLDEALASAPLW